MPGTRPGMTSQARMPDFIDRSLGQALRMRSWTLMVRSAATPHVSNHEATMGDHESIGMWISAVPTRPTLIEKKNGGLSPAAFFRWIAGSSRSKTRFALLPGNDDLN